MNDMGTSSCVFFGTKREQSRIMVPVQCLLKVGKATKLKTGRCKQRPIGS